MVNNPMPVQTFEAITDPPLVFHSGEIWQQLQDEKLDVSDRLLNESRRFTTAADTADELELQHCERLEMRLRQLSDAQDRLMEGRFGRCLDCDELITERRLRADPAAALCYECQSATHRKQRFYSL